jgi:seryl-tRNA synthetase
VLDLGDIRKDPEKYRRGIARKGGETGRLAGILGLDEERKRLIQAVEELRARQNAASREIAARKKAGEPAEALLAEMKRVKERERELSEDLAGKEAAQEREIRLLPNLPDDDVPDGGTSEDNRELSKWGAPPKFDFPAKPHWDLLGGLADPDAAGRMSGSGFTVLKGDGALLERALGQFLLDTATRKHGYTEVSVPLLMRAENMDTVTIAAKFREDMYRTTEEDALYLIPTAEHPLTNLHREQILDAESLPRRYTALTPCFRREAGAAGKDTRGLLRVHQFWKVEMMSFAHPDRSREEHERMLGNAKATLEALGLPYRVVFVCAGDMSAANRRQYDLEVWAPGVGKWLEVSSVSDFGDWQARRCGTRCKAGRDKPRFVHTLNGSALGMPRVLIGILENGQRADGNVAVPEALRPYMGGREALGPPAKKG